MTEGAVIHLDHTIVCRDGGNIAVDVVFPTEKREDRASVLFIHGGGFVGGDKSQFLGASLYLARHCSIVCVSVQYRTGKEKPYPMAVLDVVDTIDWMVNNSIELGIDKDRIVLAGGSPGANIMFLAMSPEWRRSRSVDTRNIPHYAVSLNGILDLTSFWERNPQEQHSLETYFRWRSENERIGLLLESSPSRYTYMGDRFLFLHGEKDSIVPLSDVRRMIEKVDRSGCASKLEVFKDKEHAWFNNKVDQTEVWQSIKTFIDKV